MGIEAIIEFADKDTWYPGVVRAYVHSGGFQEAYGGKIENAAQYLLNVLHKYQNGSFVPNGVKYTIPIVWGKVENDTSHQLIDLLDISGIDKLSGNPEVGGAVVQDGEILNLRPRNPITCGEGACILAEEIKNMWKWAANPLNRPEYLFKINSPTFGNKDVKHLAPKETYLLYRAHAHGFKWNLHAQKDKTQVKQIEVKPI